MHAITKISTLAGVLAITAAASGAGATTTTYYSGQLCLTADASSSIGPFPRPSENGQTNDCDCDANVFCPATWTTNSTNGQSNALEIVDAATLVYTDTSSGAFNCHVIEENWDGNIFASESLFSCGTYGGCPTNSDPGFQGQGQLNFSPSINNGKGLYATSIAIECNNMPGSGSTIRGYNFSLN
jgi:hypothetical protein